MRMMSDGVTQTTLISDLAALVPMTCLDAIYEHRQSITK